VIEAAPSAACGRHFHLHRGASFALSRYRYLPG
jgi:hypothetical protein